MFFKLGTKGSGYITADCVKEIDAQQIFGYALYKDGKDTKLSYPLESFDADVSGRSFHNGRFIQRMREKAATLPKYDFVTLLYLMSMLTRRWIWRREFHYVELADLTIIVVSCTSMKDFLTPSIVKFAIFYHVFTLNDT